MLFGEFGADTLNGGDGNDVLRGGPGNDIINGNGDIDIARFTGGIADYTIQTSASVTIVQGPDGTDTLTGIERLIFDDGSDFIL